MRTRLAHEDGTAMLFALAVLPVMAMLMAVLFALAVTNESLHHNGVRVLSAVKGAKLGLRYANGAVSLADAAPSSPYGLRPVGAILSGSLPATTPGSWVATKVSQGVWEIVVTTTERGSIVRHAKARTATCWSTPVNTFGLSIDTTSDICVGNAQLLSGPNGGWTVKTRGKIYNGGIIGSNQNRTSLLVAQSCIKTGIERPCAIQAATEVYSNAYAAPTSTRRLFLLDMSTVTTW